MLNKRLRPGHLLGGLSLALASLTAQADFAGDVTVKLLAPGGTVQGGPTPIDLTQTVAVADLASGVRAANLGGGGDISGFMLDNERVFFSGNSILLRVAVGDDTGGVYTTGALGAGGNAARYEISGLSITGQTISGYTVYAFDGFATSGFTGLLSPANPTGLVQQLDAHSFSFNLDSLVFVHRAGSLGSGDDYAEFRIDLTTTPVPEPASALLLAGGLLVLLRTRAPRRG